MEKTFSRFKDPWDIQKYLNNLDYNPENNCPSPLSVIKNKKAHCADGGIFAAAALEHLGHKPHIVALEAVNDDDHVIAPFKINGKWGCIAKSNTTLLRYREPVYKSIRELVMSFFDFYFNTKGEKSLLRYTQLINMNRFKDWKTADDLDYIWKNKYKTYDILKKSELKKMPLADEQLKKACFLFSLEEGLYKPE
jgi:hypothetical protein